MTTSNVWKYTAKNTEEIHKYYYQKLHFETDCYDVYQDIQSKSNDFILVDVRSEEDYNAYHAQGAINIPNRQITKEFMSQYSPTTKFVVYCWGPGCNGAAKAAFKLSELGYHVKEMLGGIEYWKEKELYPVESSSETVV